MSLPPSCPPPGRIAVITGGNKGIGYCIVKAICSALQIKEPESVVYLTARNEENGKAAVNQLNQEVWCKKVGRFVIKKEEYMIDNGCIGLTEQTKKGYEGAHPSFHQLDIESEDSVTRFARFIKTTHGGLDIIVNNAGIAYFTNPTVPLEVQARRTLHVNYFGTKRVCEQLFPLLRPRARVVNVSSGLGHLSKINGLEPAASLLRERFSSGDLTSEGLDELVNQYIRSATAKTHTQDGWPNSSYAVSKVAVTALTMIQQREFNELRPDDGIVVNAVHPGWVKSDMTGGKGLYSVKEGAEAPVYAALLAQDDETCPKGQYIWRDKSVVDWVDKQSIADKMKT